MAIGSNGADMADNAITLTIDLEDPSDVYASNGRYIAMTERILGLCDTLQCRATFFTIGRIALSAPDLLRSISARGHEIAYHSHTHVPLTSEDPERLRAQTRTDKDRLEQLTGKAVSGYRAPRFSLSPKSLWALDILAELGFRYSSSIMPTAVSLFGLSHAPTIPFAWPNGMLEFPLPVASLGTTRIPYLGGIYMYTLPLWAVRRFLSGSAADEVLWTYTHPYDFDSEEPYTRMPQTPLWINLVLWLARRSAATKIRRVLAMRPIGAPLIERMPARESLTTFNP